MLTLITGSTGFIGSAVLRQLLQEGHRVRALVRPASNRKNLEGLDVEVVQGDLVDRESLKRSVKGCNMLIHVAGDYRLWVPDPRRMYDCNVLGTRSLLQAAADAGAERMVYTSSVATLGLNGNGMPADESTPSSIDGMIGHYKRSKFIAEAEVLKMAREGLPVIIVNPSTPVGPRDRRPTPTGRMIRDAVNGRMPAYVDTGLNIVHVDDVARGHTLALAKGRTGERYILGGENITLKEILRLIASLTGGKPPRIRIPPYSVLPIALLVEIWARLSKKRDEPLITVTGVLLSRKLMYFSSDKAKRELGYNPRPAKEALKSAVEWFNSAESCSR